MCHLRAGERTARPLAGEFSVQSVRQCGRRVPQLMGFFDAHLLIECMWLVTCAWNRPRQRIQVDRLRHTPLRTLCPVSIALLQGASQMAILQLGSHVTDFPTPYLSTGISYGTACPTTSLVIITLV